MNENEIKLIRETWGRVVVNKEVAGKQFYDYLFRIDPNIKKLFPEDISRQAEKLISTILLIVTKVDKLSTLENDLMYLSKRHFDKYSVKIEHFPIICKALLMMLENQVGKGWNQEMKQAWEKLYGIISASMCAHAV